MAMLNQTAFSDGQRSLGLIVLKLKQQWWMWLMWLAVPLLFWWVQSRVELSEVWQPLSQLSVFEVSLLLLVKLLLELLLCTRWWLLLQGLGYRIKRSTLLGYELAGFGMSYFTPGPQVGGEALQVYMLQRKHDVPLASAVASITLDRLLGILAQAMLLVGAVGAVFMAGFSQQIASQQALLMVLPITTLPFLYITLLFLGKRPLSYLLRWLPKPVLTQKRDAFLHYIFEVEEQVGSFIRHTLVQRSRKTSTFCLALFLSLVVWPALLAIDLGLALRFFGMPVSILETLIVLIAIRVVTLMPVPAGLGTLEACMMVAMQIIGGDPAIGVALSLFVRARDVLVGVIGLVWGAIIVGGRARIRRHLPSEVGNLRMKTSAIEQGLRGYRKTR